MCNLVHHAFMQEGIEQERGAFCIVICLHNPAHHGCKVLFALSFATTAMIILLHVPDSQY